MKNIFRIFKNDVSRIRSNVIAMIVIMGITVIPTLYAWFNIAASWDPYGNTGNLKIAVASLDEGYDSELINVNLNLGDQILDTLKENDNFNWLFIFRCQIRQVFCSIGYSGRFQSKSHEYFLEGCCSSDDYLL